MRPGICPRPEMIGGIGAKTGEIGTEGTGTVHRLGRGCAPIAGGQPVLKGDIGGGG